MTSSAHSHSTEQRQQCSAPPSLWGGGEGWTVASVAVDVDDEGERRRSEGEGGRSDVSTAALPSSPSVPQEGEAIVRLTAEGEQEGAAAEEEEEEVRQAER